MRWLQNQMNNQKPLQKKQKTTEPMGYSSMILGSPYLSYSKID